MQNNDFEILAQRREIWESKDRYSSKRTPNSLKYFSWPSSYIPSLCEMSEGSTG
jgi:hypothetical protein